MIGKIALIMLVAVGMRCQNKLSDLKEADINIRSQKCGGHPKVERNLERLIKDTQPSQKLFLEDRSTLNVYSTIGEYNLIEPTNPRSPHVIFRAGVVSSPTGS